jgi:hypothetical protein
MVGTIQGIPCHKVEYIKAVFGKNRGVMEELLAVHIEKI